MQNFRGTAATGRGRRAFSLIELSIVVAILSLVSVLGLEVATSFLTTRAYDATKEKLNKLDRAMRDFYWVHGRLPCPADRTLAPTNVNYGTEACAHPYGSSHPISGTSVLGGAVPFRSLNLQPEDALDSYNSKITYHVSQLLTGDASSYFLYPGAIEVRSGRLQQPCTTACVVIASDVAYALISHGNDKRGARNRHGVVTGCTAINDSRIDAQNCIGLNGGSIVPNSIPWNVLYDSRYNPGTQPLNYFDDAIVWRRKGQI